MTVNVSLEQTGSHGATSSSSSGGGDGGGGEGCGGCGGDDEEPLDFFRGPGSAGLDLGQFEAWSDGLWLWTC